MSKLISKIRSILKSVGDRAKITVAVVLSVPGFLKVEVTYARDLTKVPSDDGTTDA